MKSAAAPFEVRAVASLASLYAFRMLGLFMVLPVLALYGQDYRHSTPLLIGLALGAYGLSQALLQVPFGLLSDRLGRKPVIALGLVLFALGSLVAAQAESVYGLILGRFLQGCGAIASAIMALLTDLTSDQGRTRAMAVIGASIGLSFSIAIVLGPLVTAAGGLSLVFWLSVALSLIGILLLFKVVPTPPVSRRHRDSEAVPELFSSVLRNGQLLRLDLGIFVLHFVLMAGFLVLPPILETGAGIYREQHWTIYLPLLLLSFIAMLPLIMITERRRKTKPALIASVLLLGVALLAMVYSQGSRLPLLLAMFLFFLAFNFLEATLPSLMSKIAPAGARGTASGVYSTSQFLGAFAGGSLSGWLLAEAGVTAVLGACALLVLVWFSVVLSMLPPRPLVGLEVLIEGVEPNSALRELTALPGVIDVMLVERENAAYLKVDPEIFQRESLEGTSLNCS